ncbi:MAG: hypothetical protein ACI376_00050 [Candidatus Bruticola sp.]
MNSINPAAMSGLTYVGASAPGTTSAQPVSSEPQSSSAADSFTQASPDSAADLSAGLAKMRGLTNNQASRTAGSVSAKCGDCEAPSSTQEADRLERSAANREAASARGQQVAEQLRAKAEQLEYKANRFNYAKQVVNNCQQRAKELGNLGDTKIARGAAILWNPYSYVMGLAFDSLGNFEMDMADAYLKEANIWTKEIENYQGDPAQDLAEAKRLRQMADHNEKLATEQINIARQERAEAARLRWTEGEYNNMSASLEQSAEAREAESAHLLNTAAAQGHIAT